MCKSLRGRWSHGRSHETAAVCSMIRLHRSWIASARHCSSAIVGIAGGGNCSIYRSWAQDQQQGKGLHPDRLVVTCYEIRSPFRRVRKSLLSGLRRGAKSTFIYTTEGASNRSSFHRPSNGRKLTRNITPPLGEILSASHFGFATTGT